MEADSQNRIRVYQRAFIRLNKIHKEIASGAFPSAQKLAEICEVHLRTIKRDIALMRLDFNASIVFNRRRYGYYYAFNGRCLPFSHLTGFFKIVFLNFFVI